MGIGGFGFAYDAMCRVARATEERRANAEYWREIRKQHQHSSAHSRPPLEHASIEDCISAQLDQGIFMSSPRRCPECRDFFALIHVHGVELDTCLECGSFWLDAGEYGLLTAHEEIIAQSLPGSPSAYVCPVCGATMTQREAVAPANLHVEACPAGHGVYLSRQAASKAFSAGSVRP
jgi:Zn-finger nucleic acid-binding protein